MAYSLIGILALALALVANYGLFFSARDRMNWKMLRPYRIFLYTILFFLITDILWGFFDQFGLSTAAYISTGIYFYAMALSVVAWIYFATNFRQEKTIYTRIFFYFGIAFLIASYTVITINWFQPILFGYEGNNYVPNTGRYSFLITEIAIFVITGAHTFIRVAKNTGVDRTRFIAMTVMAGCAICALILQICFPLGPFYALGCSIGVTVIRVHVLTRENSEILLALEDSKGRQYQQQKELGAAKQLAYTDPLTNVKNKHAYVEDEDTYDILIREGKMEDFSVIVFDLNDLKLINDTKGHDAGDLQIIKSANLIRKFFPKATIYRYGGDEFCALLTGEPYKTRHDKLKEFDAAILKNVGTQEPIVATGISDYRRDEDNTFGAVFSRADEAMYWHKRKLKQNANAKFGARSDIYDIFYHNKDCSLIEMLNNSPCDEIFEIDLKHDTFRQFYHIEGKYISAPVILTYTDLFRFACENLVHPDDREEYERQLNPDRFFQRLAKTKIPNFDFIHVRYKIQDGSYRYIEQCVIAGEENEIAPDTFRLYIIDIHNLKTRMAGLESSHAVVYEQEYNPMTGLLNETAFFKKAELLVQAKPDVTWCLISIDIEHFRFFDEWYGREKGDELLTGVGKILQEQQTLVGGLAGYFTFDDFALICPHDKMAIAELYEKIRALVVSFGLSFGFLPAFGVAIIEGNLRIVDAFDHANIALGRAKRDIRHRIHTYDPRERGDDENKYIILSEFVEGMKNDEFTFYLQPQCVISSGKIIGSEALARWVKPSGRIVPPNEYIPILEEYGFIMDMDQALWDKVAKWLRAIVDAGITPLPVSVNVSRADIFTLDIGKIFHDLAEKYDLPHNLIKIEITESAYAETTTQIAELVKQLREDGFMVLMDDFGSGYSSLNMLNSIDVDVIKIDGEFLRLNGDAYQRGIRIIESVVNMAKNLGLPLILEGVETKSQVDFLQSLGCRYAQGYYFYRPIPIAKFEELLRDESKIDRRGFQVKVNEQFRLREFLDTNIYSDSMLNNIIGAVAFYALRENGDIDIVRFNEQFYEAVGIQEFNQRLTGIQRYMPENEQSRLTEALLKAKDDALAGAEADLRFLKPNGSICFFRIHFYHIGIRDGADLFYGSAVNVTATRVLSEELQLLSRYSSDSFIFVSRTDNKWAYRVASHGLADIIGLSAESLEEEMNNGEFAKRVLRKDDLPGFMRDAENMAMEKKDFNKEFHIRNTHGKTVGVLLEFTYVGDECDTVMYILRVKSLAA